MGKSFIRRRCKSPGAFYEGKTITGKTIEKLWAND
jgi:hypothetical protein